MMKPDVLTVDFTGVYGEEGFLQVLQDRGLTHTRLSMGDIEGTSCYCDPASEGEIRRRLAPYAGEGIRWLDSGDYHYLSKILCGFVRDPFTLVLVDNHPDDQVPAFGEVLSCGSWVADLRREHPLLEEVWTLGPDHRIRNTAGTVDRPLEREIGDLMESLRGHRVYLSVDKDVLSWEYARTDWSQGSYSLDTLKGWLGELLTLDVLATDLCGERSLSKGGTPEDLAVNCRTNIDLLDFILDNLK